VNFEASNESLRLSELSQGFAQSFGNLLCWGVVSVFRERRTSIPDLKSDHVGCVCQKEVREFENGERTDRQDVVWMVSVRSTV